MKLFPENPPQITERAVRRAWSAVVVVAMLVAVGSMAGVVWLANENDELAGAVSTSEKGLAETTERLDDQRDASATLEAQVKALGGKPAVTTEGGNVVADPEGQRGPGPTSAQVNAAVKVICAGSQSPCSPTRAQVKVALRAICGDCRGQDGADAETPADGRDGTDGKDGQDAPAVTDAQIDAAVARNCGEGGCRGPGPTDGQVDDRLAAYCADGRCKGEDATITPSGMDCPEGERVNGVHLLADGSLTVSCAPLIGRE